MSQSGWRFLLARGSIVADNDVLRRYLEQQRDLGDRDFVLETILSKDVTALLRAANRPDWRSSLRNAGVEVEQSPSRASATSPGAPAPVPDANQSESEDEMKRKKGKVVEENSKLFDGPITQLRSLTGIAEKVLECRRCSLYKTAKNGVPGKGNSKARVVCIGEAPGANEDESGLPFVGAAGALLTKILE